MKRKIYIFFYIDNLKEIFYSRPEQTSPALSEGVTDLKDTEGGVSRMCDVMERYKEAAVKETKDRMCTLMALLFKNNRIKDAERAASDPQYLEQLFIEFKV